MSESTQKPEIEKSAPALDNEQRYLALLALTSQELAAREGSTVSAAQAGSIESAALFDKLDADPAALEGFIERERRGRPATRGELHRPLLDAVLAWFMGPTLRYAAAFGLAAIISIAIVMQFNRGRLIEDIEQSFANVTMSPTQASLVLPWERPAAALGFSSTAPESSEAAIEYARGLIRGKKRLMNESSPELRASSLSALGEWNILLWAASESGSSPPVSFWRAQQAVQRRLVAANYAKSAREAVSSHLIRVGLHLDALAAEQNAARSARALADELLLFREQFAPHDPGSVDTQD